MDYGHFPWTWAEIRYRTSGRAVAQTRPDKTANFVQLVSKAVKFLSVVVKMPGKQSLFSADATLESFCERIILPNMALREFEEDLFEEVPLEYLQRDLEGTGQYKEVQLERG